MKECPYSSGTYCNLTNCSACPLNHFPLESLNSTVDFGELARKTLKNPVSIRKVEEAKGEAISGDDILNLKIYLHDPRDTSLINLFPLGSLK